MHKQRFPFESFLGTAGQKTRFQKIKNQNRLISAQFSDCPAVFSLIIGFAAAHAYQGLFQKIYFFMGSYRSRPVCALVPDVHLELSSLLELNLGTVMREQPPRSYLAYSAAVRSCMGIFCQHDSMP